MKKFIFITFITLIGAVSVTGAVFYKFVFSGKDLSNPTETVILVLPNQRPRVITDELTKAGLIGNPEWFFYLGRLTGAWNKIRVGEYKITSAMSPLEIFKIITSGISIQYPVTIPEGYNLYQVGEVVERQKLGLKSRIIELAKDSKFIETIGFPNPTPSTLEGFLYPETYFFNRTHSEEDILRMMVKKFFQIWDEEKTAAARQFGMNLYQTITLASIVEKETGAKFERPMIASVFHNRIKKRMRLQSDPTTIYGIWERYDGNIHKSDLLEKTPYSTYAIEALPIGPIANPGLAAIDAVLKPAQNDYLFFVSKNDGTHHFSKTLQEHERAVRDYQINKRAREGKSWRNLKQN